MKPTNSSQTNKQLVRELCLIAQDMATDSKSFGPYIRMVAQRFLDEYPEHNDWEFDVEKASRPIRFFENVLRLDNKKFILLPWQKFLLAVLFGWVDKKTGYRRYRKCYLCTGKGSGKSPLLAGILLFITFFENEVDAESFLVAGTKSQTYATLKYVIASIKNGHKKLFPMFDIEGGNNPKKISRKKNKSDFIMTVASQGPTALSGFRSHGIGVDELHEIKSMDKISILESNVKNRNQSLMIITTNAGIGRDNVCGQEDDTARRIAEGTLIDEQYLPMVFTLDEMDDPWNDESCWIKTNPSLPAAPGYEYIRTCVEKSRHNPSKRAHQNRLLFCIWDVTTTPFLSTQKFMACEIEELPEDELEKAPCFLGLDLSTNVDLSSLSAAWRIKDGLKPEFVAMNWNWVPGDDLEDRTENEHCPYIDWAEEGHVYAVAGETIDYTLIIMKMEEIIERFNVVGMAYDPYRINTFKDHMAVMGHGVSGTGKAWFGEKQIQIIDHGQKMGRSTYDQRLWMPQSINDLELNVIEKRVRVVENPLLLRAVTGAKIITDDVGNRLFTKKKANVRIDPLVSLCMALGYASLRDNRPTEDDYLEYLESFVT